MSTPELEPEEAKPADPNLALTPDQEPSEPIEPSEPTELFSEHDKYSTDRVGQLLLIVILFGSTALLLLVLLVSLQPLRSPPPLFFKASDAAQLIEEIPLNEPGMSANVLFNWVVEGMITVLSFNFVNYATKMELARDYFTTEGFDSFSLAIQDNHVIDRVINKKYVFRALPTAAPQIIKEGVLANHYLWKIKLPMTFQYRNATEGFFEIADLTLLVVRVPTAQSAYGIKILRYELILKQGGFM